MSTNVVEIAKTELTGTPDKVETGAYKDGRGMMRLHYPEHVVTAVMNRQELAALIGNLHKALALLEGQTAKKN